MAHPRLISSLARAGGLAILLACGQASAQVETYACGDLKNPAYGPFDYRTATPEERALVEDVHFTSELERRFQGIRGRAPGEDIDYTLRAFPNHPRALLAMMKLGERDKTERPRGVRWSVECYFERAIRFRSDDAGVRLVYGIFLTKKGRKAEAIEQLQVAEKLAGEDANVHYNLGLVYFDAGEMDKALRHAHAAYALGFPLPGLKNKLERAGKWRNPPPPAEGATPPASK